MGVPAMAGTLTVAVPLVSPRRMTCRTLASRTATSPLASRATIALAVFAFNIFVVCLFALLSALFGIPDPVSQLAGTATLDDAKGILMLSGFWAIGNSPLLLGLVDAMKPKGEQPK